MAHSTTALDVVIEKGLPDHNWVRNDMLMLARCEPKGVVPGRPERCYGCGATVTDEDVVRLLPGGDTSPLYLNTVHLLKREGYEHA